MGEGHSDPRLTMDVYVRTEDQRLAGLAEKVGKMVQPEILRAHSVHKMAAGAETTMAPNDLEKMAGVPFDSLRAA